MGRTVAQQIRNCVTALLRVTLMKQTFETRNYQSFCDIGCDVIIVIVGDRGRRQQRISREFDACKSVNATYSRDCKSTSRN